MKLIKKVSYYHFNIILPSHTHAFQFAFSSHFFLVEYVLSVPHFHCIFSMSPQRIAINLIALIIFTGELG